MVSGVYAASFLPWSEAFDWLAMAGPSAVDLDLTAADSRVKLATLEMTLGGVFPGGLNALRTTYQQGIDDAEAGREPRFDLKVGDAFLEQLSSTLLKAIEARARSEREAGQKFREQEARRPGVRRTPSGLLFEVLEEGKGDSPRPWDRVRVRYRGTMVDGTEFDGTRPGAPPATFPLDSTVDGWREGVPLMRPGGRYRLVLPPELAFGSRGAGDRVPPEATLIFEIELVGIEAAPPAR